MRPRKPVLVVTRRGELRFMLRNCHAHVEVYSAESREELKALIERGCAPLLAVIDARDMDAKGATTFVAKVRESFPMVKILLLRRPGDLNLYGADRTLPDGLGLSVALIESVIALVALPRGRRKGLARAMRNAEVA